MIKKQVFGIVIYFSYIISITKRVIHLKFTAMKRLGFIFALTISSIVNAQCYTSLTQSQNKLLDQYGIDYTGLQTRYIMSTNRIDNIKDSATKAGMIESYSKFLEWNHGELQIIPDTGLVISTGTEYVKDKILTEDKAPIGWLLNDSHHLLQKVHFDINQDGIKSLEIVEFHMTGYSGCIYIYHMIFIEKFDGSWTTLSYDETDTSLDCPFCTVP